MDPITISLILYDGNPLGIRKAIIGNSVIQATVVPRLLWQNANRIEVLQNPGVYFLISAQKDDATYDVYVGQSENVFNRVGQHVGSREAENDYWNYAVCFTSTDESLHRTHALLLESMLCKLVRAMGRSSVHNGNTPRPPQVPEQESIVAQKFLSDIQVLLTTLGFPILHPLSQREEQTTYYCKGPQADAKGFYTEEGFLVLKDSLVRKEWAPNVVGERLARQQLVEDGSLEDAGDSYRFTRDYLLPTPSRAAVMVLATSANGWTKWKDEKGKTLDENERQ